jgi:hypothetical protein
MRTASSGRWAAAHQAAGSGLPGRVAAARPRAGPPLHHRIVRGPQRRRRHLRQRQDGRLCSRPLSAARQELEKAEGQMGTRVAWARAWGAAPRAPGACPPTGPNPTHPPACPQASHQPHPRRSRAAADGARGTHPQLRKFRRQPVQGGARRLAQSCRRAGVHQRHQHLHLLARQRELEVALVVLAAGCRHAGVERRALVGRWAGAQWAGGCPPSPLAPPHHSGG